MAIVLIRAGYLLNKSLKSFKVIESAIVVLVVAIPVIHLVWSSKVQENHKYNQLNGIDSLDSACKAIVCDCMLYCLSWLNVGFGFGIRVSRIASRRDSSARLGLAYRSVQPPDKMSANAVRPAVFHFYFRAVLTFFSTINNASLRRLLTILFNRKLHSNFS